MVKTTKNGNGFDLDQGERILLAKEARRRARICFARQRVVGRVLESKKFKAVKHKRQQYLSWIEE